MRTLMTLAAALLCACTTKAPVGPHQPGTVILEVGGTAVIDRLTLTFVGVDGDSRCPPGVDCVQAGVATVIVDAALPETAAARLRLLTTPADSARAGYGPYSVTLDSLAPRPLGSGRYRAWFGVDPR